MKTSDNHKNTIQRLIRRKEVQAKTGLGASSIYALMADGLFPQCINLSERRVAWIESEVDEWGSKCIAHHREVNSTKGGSL